MTVNNGCNGFPTAYEVVGKREIENKSNYDVIYTLDNVWESGFTGEITLINNGGSVIEDWILDNRSRSG